MGTGIDTARSPRDAMMRRAGRVGVLAMAAVMTVLLLQVTTPYYADRHLFSLFFFYAYVTFALWYGDFWEGVGAALASAAITAVLLPVMGYPIEGTHGFLAEAAFVATSFLLVSLAHRRRAVPTPAPAYPDPAVPVVTTNVQNPVLIIHGSAQLLQGAAVTFDTATAGQAGRPTAELRATATSPGFGGAARGNPRHFE